MPLGVPQAQGTTQIEEMKNVSLHILTYFKCSDLKERFMLMFFFSICHYKSE